MADYIVKADRETDRYFIWSSVSDSPYYIGTRAEIAEYFIAPRPGSYLPTAEEIEVRLVRTDEIGTDSLMRGRRGCSWDQNGRIRVFNMGFDGTIERQQLGLLWEALDRFWAKKQTKHRAEKILGAVLTPYSWDEEDD